MFSAKSATTLKESVQILMAAFLMAALGLCLVNLAGRSGHQALAAQKNEDWQRGLPTAHLPYPDTQTEQGGQADIDYAGERIRY